MYISSEYVLYKLDEDTTRLQAPLNFDIAGKYWNEPIELKIDEIKEILKESIRTGTRTICWMKN